MKKKGQISQKLKQVRFRHVKKEMKKLLKTSSPNCKNYTSVRGVGLCKLDCSLCEGDRAQGCETFELAHTPKEIKESLRAFFKTRETHEIAVRFPDVAALLWVLTSEGDPQDGPLVDFEPPTLFGVPFWSDTPEQTQVLTEYLGELQDKSDQITQLAHSLGCANYVDSILSEIQEREKIQATRNEFLNQENKKLSADISSIRKANQAIMRERDEERRRYQEGERYRKELALKEPEKPWWRFWR